MGLLIPRQCRYVRPISLDLLTEAEKIKNTEILAKRILINGNKLNTGFLTTHELCRVLTDYGQVETAYKLLLQTECPSWLYPVTKGATTIWESWDGVNEQGEAAGSMNHYAYGVIVGWLFDRVCGIRLECGKLTIKPIPHPSLGSAQAKYDSPFGLITSGWEYENDSLNFVFTIPCNR